MAEVPEWRKALQEKNAIGWLGFILLVLAIGFGALFFGGIRRETKWRLIPRRRERHIHGAKQPVAATNQHAARYLGTKLADGPVLTLP